MKKIFIIFVVFLLGFNFTFAIDLEKKLKEINKMEKQLKGDTISEVKRASLEKQLEKARADYKSSRKKDLEKKGKEINEMEKQLKDDTISEIERASLEKQLEKAKADYKSSYDAYCSNNSGDCFETAYWALEVGDFAPGGHFKKGKISGSGIKDRSDSFFVVLIENLMIILSFGSVLVMTIGGGYMILNMGKEEMLNKGKRIFATGIISLVIALSSYYIIQLIVDLVYN